MNTPHSVWLFTNRNIMVFDAHGSQIPDAQGAVSCYHIDAKAAARVLDQAQELYIAKWRQWAHAITRKEMQYLLGLRTKEMDLQEHGDAR
jgi:hypothetical protein